MTLPRAESERLIFVASLSLSPSAPVLACLSDPARSTKLSLPTVMWGSPPSSSGSGVEHSTVIMKMAWDLWFKRSIADRCLFHVKMSSFWLSLLWNAGKTEGRNQPTMHYRRRTQIGPLGHKFNHCCAKWRQLYLPYGSGWIYGQVLVVDFVSARGIGQIYLGYFNRSKINWKL